MEDNLIKGYIYMISSPSGRNYIGQTINIKRRLKEYNINYKKFRKQPKLYNDCIKYNYNIKDNLSIIETIYFNRNDRDENKNNELDRREIYWIQYYDTYKNGMNCNKGGSSKIGYSLTQETKDKISLSNKNRVRTDEQKENISKGRTGLKLSKHHCNKISERMSGENHPNYQKETPNEVKLKIKNSLYKYNINKIDYIIVYDKQMNFIGIYRNVIECSNDIFGEYDKHISDVLLGKKKSRKGYIFKKLKILEIKI